MPTPTLKGGGSSEKPCMCRPKHKGESLRLGRHMRVRDWPSPPSLGNTGSNDALMECTSKGMTREQVYLLGRMGGSRRALEIIVDDLGDIPQAIAFVQEQGADNDDELWDELIARAVAKPGCVCDLLDNVGSLFDPRRVLSRIPPALVVEGLRDRLTGILGDSRGTQKLWSGCKDVVKRDVSALSHVRFKEARRAFRPNKVIIED